MIQEIDVKEVVDYYLSQQKMEGKEISLSPIVHPSPGADNPFKYLLSYGRQKAAVIFFSREEDPLYMDRAAKVTAEIRESLPQNLANRVLNPIVNGVINEISYAIFPYCKPLSSHPLLWRIQRRLLRSSLADWLCSVAKETQQSVSFEELNSHFFTPLDYIKGDFRLPQAVRKDAYIAEQRLLEKQWSPKFVLMHHDFWRENILINPSSNKAFWWNRFILIDWPGAKLKGYPLYDLLRFAHSFALPRRELDAMLRQYANLLSCEREDLRGYLLVALGAIGQDLRYFPFEKYKALVGRMYSTLNI